MSSLFVLELSQKSENRIAVSSTPGVGMKAGPFDASVGIVIAPVEHTENGDTVMIFLDLRPGIDADALGDLLLASPHISETAASATDATSTASTTPSYLNNFLKNLFAKIATWLADAANGITDLFAAIIHANEVHAKKFCAEKSDGSEFCANGDQLAAILSAPALAGQTTAGDSGPPPAESPAENDNEPSLAATTTIPSDPTAPLDENVEPDPPQTASDVIPDSIDEPAAEDSAPDSEQAPEEQVPLDEAA